MVVHSTGVILVINISEVPLTFDIIILVIWYSPQFLKKYA